MIINYAFDLLEKFYKNPKPIILYESVRGAVNISKAYLSYLAKKQITPKMVINAQNFLEPSAIEDQYGKGYILLTGGSEKNKQQDAKILEQLSNHFEVYYDFPFNVSAFDLPYLRTYDEDNQWFWDMINGGIGLYDENPKAYVEGCFQHNGWMVKNGALVLNDFASKYVNITNGIRKTIAATVPVQHRIYITGACIAYGDRTDDSRTIASVLQFRINKIGLPYEVVNFGVNNTTIQNALQIIKHTDIQSGDYVFYIDDARTIVYDNTNYNEIFFSALQEFSNSCHKLNAKFVWLRCPSLDENPKLSNFEKLFSKRMVDSVESQRNYIQRLHNCGMENIKLYKGVSTPKNVPIPRQNIHLPVDRIADYTAILPKCLTYGICVYDLAYLYRRPHEFIEIYTDNFHVGYMGYTMIADLILNTWILENKTETYNPTPYAALMDQILIDGEMASFVSQLKQISQDHPANAGAIVMNCNPFTYGHRYLIETALNMTDHLYILVVEEDLSEFSFAERFQMVKEGVADLSRVTVLPSGKFVISSVTFPKYFTKEEVGVTNFDASKDLTFFATKVAPALKVTKRFVGEEPLDPITNEYNKQMKKLLVDLGIEVLEIPRLQIDEKTVNATQVRKWIKENEWNLLKQFVPECIYQGIQRHVKLNGGNIPNDT